MNRKIVRVLALNDDCHETSYHEDRRKTPYYDGERFIEELSRPHNYEYDIRKLSIYQVDDNPTLLKAFENVINDECSYL